MPSRPPETEFYDLPENYTLWRDLSRLYEDFMGDDEEEWPGRSERFTAVLNDVQGRLAQAEKENQ